MITIPSALQSRLLSSLRQCARVAATIALLTTATGALAQDYKTPDEAATALIGAAKAADRPALMRVLGPGSAEIGSSGDEVADAAARTRVIEHYDTTHSGHGVRPRVPRHRQRRGRSRSLVRKDGLRLIPLPAARNPLSSIGRWLRSGVARLQ